MKKRKLLALLVLTAALSGTMTACSLGGGDDDQLVVEATPTPEPTKAPTPTPTIAPDMQETTYTSADGSVSIEKPDATWANKTDMADMIGFESPDQGKILILHGSGEEDMSSAVIPTTQDMAVALEQASNLTEGTDFQIEGFSALQVNGVGVYSYTVKYTDTTKGGGYLYVVNKYIADANEYYSLAGSVVKEDALEGVKAAVDSFKILGDSTLKPATEEGAQAAAQAEGQTGGTAASGLYTAEQLADTNQTRTIYRNSDGYPIVVVPGDSGWVDRDGNVYSFADDGSTVYDQNEESYYYHGEAGDVCYSAPTASSGSSDTGSTETQSTGTDTTGSGTTRITNTDCNIREAADGNSDVIGVVDVGIEVSQLGTEGDWVKVQYDGITGYIHGNLLD